MKLPPVRSRDRTPCLLRLICNGLLQASCGLLMLLLIRTLYQGQSSGWAYAAAGLLLTTLLSAALRYRERLDAETLGQSYAHQTRLLLFDKLCQLPLNQRERLRNGSQMLRFVGDLSALQLWIGRGLSRVATALFTLVIAIAGLAWFDYRLALTELAVLLPLGALMLLQGKQLQQRLQESRKRRAYLSANIHEKLAAIATIQLFGQQRREHNYLERQSARLQRGMVRRAATLGALSASAELAVGGTLAALFSVSYLLPNRPASADLVMAFSLIILQTPALRQLSRVYGYWQGYRLSCAKLQTLLQRPGFAQTVASSNPPFQKQPTVIQAEVQMTSAPDTPRPLPCAQESGWKLCNLTLPGRLQGINATIPCGSRIALVGPSGSGKSALLLVLARLLEPTSPSQVCLDGLPLAVLPLSCYRRRVALVSEEAPLLRGSLRKNLRYRHGKVSKRERQRILTLCGIDQLLEQLPAGLDFQLRDAGRNLSRGQRLQIALARALMGKPQLLLIDDADSGLDTPLRQRVQAIIRSFSGTVVFSTHSPELLQMADRCWQLQHGQLLSDQSNHPQPGAGQAAERSTAATSLMTAAASLPTRSGEQKKAPPSPLQPGQTGTIHPRGTRSCLRIPSLNLSRTLNCKPSNKTGPAAGELVYAPACATGSLSTT